MPDRASRPVSVSAPFALRAPDDRNGGKGGNKGGNGDKQKPGLKSEDVPLDLSDKGNETLTRPSPAAMARDAFSRTLKALRFQKPRVKLEGKGKPINLALQGGGAHGAYTWGVIDRLLEDDRLEIESISGTSAGAMNGVLVAHGLTKGGRPEAKRVLEAFWRSIGEAAIFSPFRRTWIDRMMGTWNLDHSPWLTAIDIAQLFWSPYQFNPLNYNPLRDLLAEMVDFEAVHACDRIQVFVTATNVRTGKARVFRQDEVTLDAVMASACLPFLYQAVKIDGDPYWDGGYTGNPALWPLIYLGGSRDVVLVQINPLVREGTPTTPREIFNRLNEITFNASLMREMRAIQFVSRLIDEGHLSSSEYKKMFIHVIDAEDELRPLSASSKLNAEWAFFKHLHDIGYRAAGQWVEENAEKVGTESTVDVALRYL